MISGWQGSFWDLSGERERVESLPEEELLEIRVSSKTYRALNEISYLDRETEQILASGVRVEGGVVLVASPDDFDELLNLATAEANHARRSRDRRRMSEALREIEELLSRPETESLRTSGGDRTPEEIRSITSKLVQNGKFSTLDDFNRALSVEIGRYNRRPREELAGLSFESLHWLLHCKWSEEEAPIRLNDSLPLEELEGSELFSNARIYLLGLDRWKEVRATGAGNLPRKFVKEMSEAFQLDDLYRDMLHCVNKVLNEGDFFPLHLVRVLCDLAGLAVKRKQRFRITQKGRALVEEEQSGPLFARLFDIHFRKFNLAYRFHFGPDAPSLQVSVPYTLYRISRLSEGPYELSRLAPDLVIPAVRNDCGEEELTSLLRWRVLEPLRSFGLLEVSKDKSGLYLQKRPLFERFLEFRI